MATAWVLVAVLYATQLFSAVKPTPRGFTQFVPPMMKQPAVTPNQTEVNKKPPVDPNAAYILNFHHGTLATIAPADSNNNTIFGYHVTVYIHRERTYQQICGGSLVKKDTALSAAHCFWDDVGLMPAELFAAAVGDGLRRWDNAKHYRTDISEIIIPPRFLGVQTNFQDDIAVLRLITPVEYLYGVHPVCVDFSRERSSWHLRNGVKALITGFGLTEENGAPSPVLNYQLLPYVEISECLAASDPGFLRYLTSDKICAGDQKTGRALCRGDSGGGLVFFDGFIDTPVKFLYGIASAAPRNDNECNAFAIGSFTDIRAHRTFLRDNIPNLEEECKTVFAKELEPKYTLKPVKPVNVGSGSQNETNDKGVNEDRNTGVLVTAGKPNEGTQVSNNSQINASVLNTPEAPSDDITTNLNGVFLQKGPTKPAVSVDNENSDVRVKGNPNTNIFFFTGSLVSPSGFLQANATPIFLGSRAEQPTNIYVFIQN